MRHPVDKVKITQGWGENPDVYARFGLKGHNGIDYRLFDDNGNKATTAKVYAPHEGRIIEAGHDENGYGNYLKIENDKEGSILAHLDSFKVSVGDSVSEGQLVAIADNTGFSTGAHLHWGYYPKPRFRNNGYSGTINQIDLVGRDETPENKQLVIDILLALKGDTSDNEIEAWLERFENPKDMIIELMKADIDVFNKWIMPEVLGATDSYEQALMQCKKDLKECRESQPEPPGDAFVPKTALGAFLYKLAKSVG